MTETTKVEEFDATKLMGFAKELFDAMPTLLAELDAHKGEFPVVDAKVAEVKAELMRINGGGEPGPHARMLLPLLAEFAKRQSITATQETPQTQTKAHEAPSDESNSSFAPMASTIHALNRYGS